MKLEGFCSIVESNVANEGKWEAGLQLFIQAVLVSPKFLFWLELDHDSKSTETRPIDEYQLPCRLPYFLWSSMPDSELMELAANKQLTANLSSQVNRMLKDLKLSALVDKFAFQWLQLYKLQSVATDSKLFPSFNEPLRFAMLQETRLFIKGIIREDHSITEFLTADFTYLNEPLAKHYGIIDTFGTKVRKKPFKPGAKPIKGQDFVRVNL